MVVRRSVCGRRGDSQRGRNASDAAKTAINSAAFAALACDALFRSKSRAVPCLPAKSPESTIRWQVTAYGNLEKCGQFPFWQRARQGGGATRLPASTCAATVAAFDYSS
jgi:hypothetical protein